MLASFRNASPSLRIPAPSASATSGLPTSLVPAIRLSPITSTWSARTEAGSQASGSTELPGGRSIPARHTPSSHTVAQSPSFEQPTSHTPAGALVPQLDAGLTQATPAKWGQALATSQAAV